MATFQPPPTWALPVNVDEKTGKSAFNPVWLKWFVDLAQVLDSIGSGGTAIGHNGLMGLQGGGTSQFYHLTSSEYTGTGSGNFVRATSPTLITPSLGAATATSLASGTVKVTNAAGFISSDNSAGITTTITSASLVGKTITIKDGIITGFA